jgi:hypothetical protein
MLLNGIISLRANKVENIDMKNLRLAGFFLFLVMPDLLSAQNSFKKVKEELDISGCTICSMSCVYFIGNIEW